MTKVKFDSKNHVSKQAQILDALRKAGAKGLANFEMYDICQRWAARLQELYKQGYKVRVENLGDGIYNYILVEEPTTILPIPERAQDILIREIEGKCGGKVTTAQLLNILQSNRLQVGRKARSYNA
ncbi:hypothetical protein [Paenibacillus sp. NPDC057967]|uniref:hypothetical protein n=1 Tax=Paenibacillus sp. NPDC057967 TaxID=3346293 RepID=UPI0036DDF3B4